MGTSTTLSQHLNLSMQTLYISTCGIAKRRHWLIFVNLFYLLWLSVATNTSCLKSQLFRAFGVALHAFPTQMNKLMQLITYTFHGPRSKSPVWYLPRLKRSVCIQPIRTNQLWKGLLGKCLWNFACLLFSLLRLAPTSENRNRNR